uniref:histidine kinase n=1 Tax=Chromera velia CCMP2878 TaxID=1169474 RepID=A0A0G4HEG0_9ALVE|eukprot:Cvel_26752.t1-p1 / transcript=Cvel_26752.t1 / gene=Cvel_26752 / organism=Chromera_velia_CCMP2878 / gene_product=hypothetical protein / transcript_product=hypothetical protein / location=Cvel_scaffold3231:13506-15969(-) / protein_length=546 / sequence_SO=supercontig / SO=protein_coding / is_pseudo=false
MLEFRKRCFAKQLSLLAPLIFQVCIPSIGSILLFGFLGHIPLLSGLLYLGSTISLAVALTPGLFERRDQATTDEKGKKDWGGRSLDARETITFVAFFVDIVCFHMAAAVNNVGSTALIAATHGANGWIMKMNLVSLHFSDTHFWLLHILDSGVHTVLTWTMLARAVGPEAAPELCQALSLNAVMTLIIVTKYRSIVNVTIAEAHREVILREKAEKARNSFMSYIMHEMRNPLSGASLLVSEFQSVLQEVLSVGSNCISVSCQATRKKMLSLLRLAMLLSGQFDKMRGVCDDVLQMEKLDRGGFEFVFSSGDPRAWFDDVATQAAPLFGVSTSNMPQRALEGAEEDEEEEEGEENGADKTTSDDMEGRLSPPTQTPRHSASGGGAGAGSVHFSSAFEVSPEVQEEMKTHAVSVADFRRLEQVVGNFVSNARKFTKKGSVHMQGELRMPTDEEKEQLAQLLLEGTREGKKRSPRNRKPTNPVILRLSFLGSRGLGETDKSPSVCTSVISSTRQWRESVRELRDLQKEEDKARQQRRRSSLLRHLRKRK